MKTLHLASTAGLLASILTATNVSAAIDADAPYVELRQSCTVAGVNEDNCFSNYNSLNTWIRDTRRPNANTPLHVSIGPGVFDNSPASDIYINCQPENGYTGHTTYKGSGSQHTVLQGTGSGNSSAVNINNCTELEFADMKITTTFYGGVYWNGGGNSRWTNVDVETNGRAWAETTCGTEPGKHYWFSSKLNTNAVFGIAETYRASCDETWFFGSEVKSTIDAGQSAISTAGTVSAYGDGIIHLYGSNLRSIGHGDSTPPAAAAGAGNSGGEIHIHGTGIDVISTSGNDIVALKADNSGFIHADVSAYVMQTSGNKTRIQNIGGTIKAPYQWSQSNQPPVLSSETGADMAVETNCDETGCHDVDTGMETHLLIYNNNCDIADHGPWFDVVTGKCRGDMSQ